LQFAFEGGADNPYLPHNHIIRCVVYTGTHDNDTTLGWWNTLPEEQKRHVLDYLGKPGEAMPDPLMRAALMSVARLAVVPMQDILRLGSEARMNRPSTSEGNWRWRFQWVQLKPELEERYARFNGIYGRRLKP
ncbi:MAG: 4-alpha-glucanotransferase, partial [Gammaproteobacteria bacterium]